ncbi:unnamed protein product [Boreogadus saida]
MQQRGHTFRWVAEFGVIPVHRDTELFAYGGCGPVGEQSWRSKACSILSPIVETVKSEMVGQECALLYTTVGGQRRLPVHNLSLNCSSQLMELFKSCETDSLINFFAKTAYRAILKQPLKSVREILVNQTAHKCWPATARTVPAPLPPASVLRVLDWMPGLSSWITGQNHITIFNMMYMYLPHNMELEGEAVPLRCSEDRLSDGGAVLLENGHALFLWLGQACPPELIQGLFNLPSLAHLQPNTVSNARRLPSPSN